MAPKLSSLCTSMWWSLTESPETLSVMIKYLLAFHFSGNYYELNVIYSAEWWSSTLGPCVIYFESLSSRVFLVNSTNPQSPIEKAQCLWHPPTLSPLNWTISSFSAHVMMIMLMDQNMGILITSICHRVLKHWGWEIGKLKISGPLGLVKRS